jgi:hypothetical protein
LPIMMLLWGILSVPWLSVSLGYCQTGKFSHKTSEANFAQNWENPYSNKLVGSWQYWMFSFFCEWDQFLMNGEFPVYQSTCVV